MLKIQHIDLYFTIPCILPMTMFKYPVRHFRRREKRYFQNVSSGAGTNSIRSELGRLVSTVAKSDERKAFIAEMQTFYNLYNRYLAEHDKDLDLDWQNIRSPAENQILHLEQLPVPSETSSLKKLAILKFTGGLGTTMGVSGAKGALEVQNKMTFLDLAVQQVEHLNKVHAVGVPLLFMTSFKTSEDSLRIIKNNAQHNVKITAFNQSKYPKLSQDLMLLSPKNVKEDPSAWYPPGHGDLYNSLFRTGVLSQLLAEGKEYLFVSNSDNLGAVADPAILQYMISTDTEFVMEVTKKTKPDMQGGTLVDHNGSLRLLELAQVPPAHWEEFQSVRNFNMFNTNNLWINLKALKRIMEQESLALDIIANSQTTERGQSLLQLQTAAGSAIKYFRNARGISVPRSRFLPVKTCSDLLLVKSDIYTLDHGRLLFNENRLFGTIPIVNLGERFQKIQDFQYRFRNVPKMIDLDHLTVTGDVYFGRDVTLRGVVIITANEGQRIDIPDGCILENRLISGNLIMTEL